jgi:hypothetical protein
VGTVEWGRSSGDGQVGTTSRILPGQHQPPQAFHLQRAVAKIMRDREQAGGVVLRFRRQLGFGCWVCGVRAFCVCVLDRVHVHSTVINLLEAAVERCSPPSLFAVGHGSRRSVDCALLCCSVRACVCLWVLVVCTYTTHRSPTNSPTNSPTTANPTANPTNNPTNRFQLRRLPRLARVRVARVVVVAHDGDGGEIASPDFVGDL